MNLHRLRVHIKRRALTLLRRQAVYGTAIGLLGWALSVLVYGRPELVDAFVWGVVAAWCTLAGGLQIKQQADEVLRAIDTIEDLDALQSPTTTAGPIIIEDDHEEA